MTIGEAGRNPGDLVFRIAQLERQVADLLSARRLVSAAVGAGGLRIHGGGGIRLHGGGGITVDDGGDVAVSGGGTVAVQDDIGNPQVRMGPLDAGGFGLEQLVGNRWVPLAALAGGAEADVVPDEETLIEPAGSTVSRSS